MATSGNRKIGLGLGRLMALESLIAAGKGVRSFAAGVSVASLMAASTTAFGYDYAQVPLFWSNGVQPNVMLMLDNSGSMASIVTNESFNKAVIDGSADTQPEWYFCSAAYDNTNKRCTTKYTSRAIRAFAVQSGWKAPTTTSGILPNYIQNDYSGTGYGGKLALCNTSKAPGATGFYTGLENSKPVAAIADMPTADTVGVLVSNKSTANAGTRDACVHWRMANTENSTAAATPAGRDDDVTWYDDIASPARSSTYIYPRHLLNTLVPAAGSALTLFSINFSDTVKYPISDSDTGTFTAATDDKVIPNVNRMEAAREVAQKVVLDNYDKMQIGLTEFRKGSVTSKCDEKQTSGMFDAEAQKTLLIGTANDMTLVPDSTIDGTVGALTASGGTPLAATQKIMNDYFNGSSSPIKYRCQKNFTVLMTDGDPSSVTSPTLDGYAQSGYDTDFKVGGTDSAGVTWDDTTDPEWVKQNVTTYTIGFGLENNLLKHTPLTNRKTVTGTSVVGNIIPVSNHGLATGDMIELVSGATVSPAATVTSSSFDKYSTAGKYYYYVAKVDGNNFKLANTKAKAITCASGTTADCGTISVTGTNVVVSTGPGKSYFAFTPDQLASSLNSAFSDIRNLTASSSAVSASTKNVGTGGALVYQANFNTADWGGTVKAYPVNTDGSVSTTATWTTGTTLDTAAERTNVLTWRDDTNVPVTLAYTNLSAAQQSYISNKATGATTPTGDATVGGNVVSWLLGNTPAGFRAHPAGGLLGDVINADPLFVGALNYAYHKLPPSASTCTVAVPTSSGSGCTGAETYSNYVTASKTRTPMLYVGANDGMMHALNASSGASGGTEVMAYIPSAVYERWEDDGAGTVANADNNAKNAGETENVLYSLTQNDYLGTNKHHFFVDGSTAVGDVFLGGSWKTYMVGTLGAGGRGVYAIDISTPSAAGLGTSAIKWDYSYKSVIGSDSTTAPKLGYTLGKPVIGRLGDNNWYAFIPNGTDSNDDKARVFVIRLGDAATSLNVRTLEVTDGASKTSPNGMMVIQARVDSARTIKTIYGGDMQGNVWKFDLSGITSGSSAWPGTVTTPLFTATTSGAPSGTNRQAITGGMRLGEYPGTTDTIVYFGTGKYFENVDKLFNASTSKPLFDSFYAVLDKGTTGLNKTQLTAQTFTAEGTNTRTATATAWDNSKFGWYIDLKLATAANGKGERVLTQPLLYGGRIIFVSMFPAATDPCNSTGTSWLNELDALSGSQITEDGHGVLDTNGNGVIDSGDAVIASVKVEGMASEPSVIQNAAGQEFKVMGSTSRATPIRSIAESTPPGVGLPGGAGRMSWSQLQ